MQVMVTQAELKEIFELQRDVAPKLQRIEELKSNVKALLIHKMPVEMGLFSVRLKSRFNRHVTWKQGFVEKLGLAAAKAYEKTFPPRMFCDVIVEDHAVAPLWRGGEPGREEPEQPSTV
jgi:hypothetical protein